MNRRAFLTALAAVTGAASFPWLPEHEQPAVLGSIDHSTNIWWRREGKSCIGGLSDPELAKEMERLWKECMRDSNSPDLIRVGDQDYQWLKSEGYIA